jgi:acyl-CoA synthetase (AMP-forming)/AMP-acid ligase II
VLVIYASANRDERVFENPAAFDVTRQNTVRQLGFGIGERGCAGQGLARMHERCEGHGLCEEQAPEVFELDDAGVVVHWLEGRELPEELAAVAVRGASVCGDGPRGQWRRSGTRTAPEPSENGSQCRPGGHDRARVQRYTGDLGELDDAGFLTITGRKKELIVTAGGKNVAPAALEDRLRAHPLVSQCEMTPTMKVDVRR